MIRGTMATRVLLPNMYGESVEHVTNVCALRTEQA